CLVGRSRRSWPSAASWSLSSTGLSLGSCGTNSPWKALVKMAWSSFGKSREALACSVGREFDPETGSPLTGSSASYYVLDIAYIIVFLGSLFSREFAGVTGLVFKAIRGRDGCTRDFSRGRYENLSGAISWLTFFAGRAAHVRRSQRDWRRELAESTICSQQKPRSFRCSAQSVGSRGVTRINVLAVR